jgi:hypothetical protein
MNSSHLNLLLGALVWFGIVTWLAAKGVFVSAPDERPLTLALTFVAPILLSWWPFVFLAGGSSSSPFLQCF